MRVTSPQIPGFDSLPTVPAVPHPGHGGPIDGDPPSPGRAGQPPIDGDYDPNAGGAQGANGGDHVELPPRGNLPVIDGPPGTGGGAHGADGGDRPGGVSKPG